MVKRDKFMRFERRKMSTKSIAVPDQTLNVRVLIDRVSKGLPVNSKMRQHIPLPLDGEDLNDFDTGTEHILDVTDAAEHVDRIKAQQKHIAEQKQKAIDNALGKTEAPPTADVPPLA